MYLHSYHLYWWEFLKQNCTGRRDSCPGGKTPATSTLRSSLFLRGLPCWWRPLRSLQRRSAGLLQLSGAASVAAVKSREEMTEKSVVIFVASRVASNSIMFRCFKKNIPQNDLFGVFGCCLSFRNAFQLATCLVLFHKSVVWKGSITVDYHLLHFESFYYYTSVIYSNPRTRQTWS